MFDKIERAAKRLLPESAFFFGRSVFTLFHPGKETSLVVKWDGKYWEYNSNVGPQSIRCSPVPYRWPHPSDAQRNRVEKYTLDGFVDIEQGDVLIEVGGFTGEFTLPASTLADEVYSFEPDPITAECLQYNTKRCSNVNVFNAAAWNEDDTLTFFTGNHPSDNSLIDIDEGEVQDQRVVEAIRLETFVEEQDLGDIDFLKVDAEGAEPEVIEGLGDLNVRKIAVDCTAERAGQSTADEVREYLVDRGYEIRIDSSVLFARHM